MKRQRVILTALVIVFTLAALVGSGLVNLGSLTAFATEKKAAKTKINSRIPKMIDLGSKGCIPCKRMAPILDSLREEYKGKADIVFIDIKENRTAATEHKITLIPTQVFFDTTGKEVYRHIGFFPADSIETHLKALGVKQ